MSVIAAIDSYTALNRSSSRIIIFGQRLAYLLQPRVDSKEF